MKYDPDTFHREFFIDTVLSFLKGSFVFICLNRKWRERYKKLHGEKVRTLIKEISNLEQYKYAVLFDFCMKEKKYCIARFGCMTVLKYAIQQNHISTYELSHLLQTAVDSKQFRIVRYLIDNDAYVSWGVLIRGIHSKMGNLLLKNAEIGEIKHAAYRAAKQGRWKCTRMLIQDKRINPLHWTKVMSIAVWRNQIHLVLEWLDYLDYIPVNVFDWIRAVKSVFQLACMFRRELARERIHSRLKDIGIRCNDETYRIIDDIYSGATLDLNFLLS